MSRPGGNIDCIYGETGTYKTTNLGFFAEWIYKTTGLPTRLVSGDPGGYRPIQDYINAGIIEPISLLQFKNPMAAMSAFCKGQWLEPDKKSGMMKFVDAKPGEIEQKVGGYAFEGLTSWCDLMHNSLRDKGPQIGEQPSYKFVDVDQESGARLETHGGNRSYYGFMQNRVYDLLIATNALPVHRVLWTAHESEFSEDGARAYGPGVAGVKASPKVPSWVGGCIHFYNVVTDGAKIEGAKNPNVKDKVIEVRGYFRSHPDLFTGGIYKAKPRVPAHLIEKLMEKYPGGYFTLRPDGGYNDFLDTEAELLAVGTDKRTTWKKGIDAERAERLAELEKGGC